MSLQNLFNQLDSLRDATGKQEAKIIAQIQQAIFDTQYSDWKALQSAIACLDNGEGVKFYIENGDIRSFVHLDLSEVPERERQYLEVYLADRGVEVDWSNEVLSQCIGPDCLIIQDEHGRDNGVYQSFSLIIEEAEYLDDDGDVDTVKRNFLIEEHMRRTGVYPGVFRVTLGGDAYLVNTQT